MKINKNNGIKKLITTVSAVLIMIFGFTTFVHAEDDIDPKNISDFEPALTSRIFKYTGTAIEPEIVVEGLEREKDYTVNYEDNIKPGTGHAVISGKGDYCGKTTLGFIIRPYAPKDLKAVLTGHDDVKLTWTSVPDVAGYFIYYKQKSNEEYTYFGKTSGNTMEIKDLKNHVNYDFKVESFIISEINSVKYKSSDFCTTEIMTKKYIESPAIVETVLYGHDDVKVTWSEVEGAAGYSVYYKKASQKTYDFLGETDDRYFEKANLNDGVKYVFLIRPRYIVNDKYYEGYFGRKSSIYTLIKPEATITRCGFEKIRFKWTDINGEVGYQISKSAEIYKTNVIHTIKDAGAGSRKIAAPVEKKYYYRVRAYTVTDDKRIYGPWSDRISYTTDEQYYPKITGITKNGKTMDIKAVAGQKLYAYDTVQGSCTDGKYGYYALYNRNVDKCKIAKIRLSDNKLIKVSKELGIHHGNDLAYNSRTNKVMAVHMTGRSMAVGVIASDTLKLEKNVTIKIPESLPGASSFKIKKIAGFNAIAYDSESNRYVLRIRELGDYLITDGRLNPTEYVTPNKKKHKSAVYAGLDIVNGYIASVQYRYNSGGYNLIQLHDWEGKYIGTANINKKYELESSFNTAGKVYAVYYYSHTTNGRANRSNYIYKFDF